VWHLRDVLRGRSDAIRLIEAPQIPFKSLNTQLSLLPTYKLKENQSSGGANKTLLRRHLLLAPEGRKLTRPWGNVNGRGAR
jgi:hypothetical protein